MSSGSLVGARPADPEFATLPRAVEWVSDAHHVLGDLAQFEPGGAVGGHEPAEIAASQLYQSDLMRLRKAIDRVVALGADVRVSGIRSIAGFDCSDRLAIAAPAGPGVDVTDLFRGLLDLRTAPTDRVLLAEGPGRYEIRYSLLSVVSLERPEWCEPG